MLLQTPSCQQQVLCQVGEQRGVPVEGITNEAVVLWDEFLSLQLHRLHSQSTAHDGGSWKDERAHQVFRRFRQLIDILYCSSMCPDAV